MAQFSFICPKTGKKATFTQDVPDDVPLGARFAVTCAQCGESHRFRASEVRRLGTAAKKMPSRKQV
jgi:RNase P subunit RPR2